MAVLDGEQHIIQICALQWTDEDLPTTYIPHLPLVEPTHLVDCLLHRVRHDVVPLGGPNEHTFQPYRQAWHPSAGRPMTICLQR
jgi:hypothetical protein